MVYISFMKIVLGADHGGWQMKEEVKKWLCCRYDVEDVGAEDELQGDDYIDYAVLLVRELEKDSKTKGILFCKNGFGMTIAANRFGWVRCGLGFDIEAVRRGKNDDDINCLAVPSEYLETEEAKEMIRVFLETEFSGKERYRRRLLRLKSIK